MEQIRDIKMMLVVVHASIIFCLQMKSIRAALGWCTMSTVNIRTLSTSRVSVNDGLILKVMCKNLLCEENEVISEFNQSFKVLKQEEFMK
ncbi:unnamed protein product [Arabidopsis halleri]